MFGYGRYRFTTYATGVALIATASSPFAQADAIFSDDFEAPATGSQPAWSAVSDNNNSVKFRVANSGDPFGVGGGAGENEYLLTLDTHATAGGNATVRGLAGAANIATLSFDFVEPTRANAGSRLYLQVGQTAGTLGADADRAFQFSLNNGTWIAHATGSNPSTSYSLDVKHSVTVVMNYSAASTSYTGPGGASETLTSGKCDLYIDGVRVLDDASRFVNNANPTLAIGTPLSAFNFQTFGSDANQELLIDNVLFQTGAVIPEPVSAGLMGLGVGAMASRRR